MKFSKLLSLPSQWLNGHSAFLKWIRAIGVQRPQAAYRAAINKYIIPLIGKQRLNQLTKAWYEYLFVQPLLDKLATYTVHNYNILVMTIMNAAVEPIKDASVFNNFHKVLAGAGIPKDLVMRMQVLR